MTTIGDDLTAEHRRCGAALVDAEAAVAEERWDGADAAFDALESETERHFQAEESVLFPRLEAATGSAGRPIAVAREEHDEKRRLLAGMRHALGGRDGERFLDGCETVLLKMQQHNLKEEDALYPMSEHALADGVQETLDAIRACAGR